MYLFFLFGGVAGCVGGMVVVKSMSQNPGGVARFFPFVLCLQTFCICFFISSSPSPHSLKYCRHRWQGAAISYSSLFMFLCRLRHWLSMVPSGKILGGLEADEDGWSSTTRICTFAGEVFSCFDVPPSYRHQKTPPVAWVSLHPDILLHRSCFLWWAGRRWCLEMSLVRRRKVLESKFQQNLVLNQKTKLAWNSLCKQGLFER